MTQQMNIHKISSGVLEKIYSFVDSRDYYYDGNSSKWEVKTAVIMFMLSDFRRTFSGIEKIRHRVFKKNHRFNLRTICAERPSGKNIHHFVYDDFVYTFKGKRVRKLYSERYSKWTDCRSI